MQLTAKEVMDLIPNRYPIFYIDKVTELIPDKTISGEKLVTINEDFFQNQTGELMMPNMLIIETLAQLGSILLLKSEAYLGKRAYIGNINKGVFHQPVTPGNVLEMAFTIKKQKATVGVADAVAFVAGKKVCECELTFIINDQA